MRKFIYAFTLVSALIFSITPAIASDKKANKPTELTAEQKVKLDKIVNRVEEIRNMDKSNLTKEERKALRSELKDLKEQARDISDGIYLSFAAIIIIILLLILIL
ncbi:hypothetical protein [Pedobacter flavus]|uniref:Seryl-tRNA synthetase n=1 Tax=Pedobacter flavus TaxID=3113906 RepID=A0ABU7H0W0_9SPHI|nr:hypothetical protein [Pedobacter sp. VNH31]MEE1884853.1 hypothetical protein [Pedobacter sp. VNH31]